MSAAGQGRADMGHCAPFPRLQAKTMNKKARARRRAARLRSIR